MSPTQPKLRVDFVFNLMHSGDQTFSASTRLFLTLRKETEELVHEGPFPVLYTKIKWRFDKITIGGIQVETNTSPFYLKGVALFRENDPVYGNGFAGNLRFLIRNVTKDTAIATCVFGHTAFRYWYADVFVPVNIPLGPGTLTITRIAGGMYHHMRPQKSTAPEYIQALGQNPAPGQSTQVYLPDENFSLGFKAGCRFKYTASERAANGDVMLEVLFTTSGGLHSAKLNGDIYMMCSIADRLLEPAAIKGSGHVLLDVSAHLFDAQFTVQVKAGDQLSGVGTAGFHIDPDHWYFTTGRPSSPISVSLGSIAAANGYFMIGNLLEPMAPVPYQVSSLVSNAGLMNLRNQDLLANGGGFCCGLRFSSYFYKEIGWDFFRVYGGFNWGAGFDLMLTHLNHNIYCGNISSPGMNRWMAQGQLYLYLSGTIGIKGHIEPQWCHADWCSGDFDIGIFNGSLAAILFARGPNPSYFNGTVACSYSILGIINGNLEFPFEAGNSCTLTGS